MKKSTFLGLGLVFVAGTALASNTGFKLNYPLQFTLGLSNNNWLSVPYFYFPNGNVGVTPQNSLDFCRDLNGGAGTGKVTQIVRYITSTDSPKTQSCSSAIKVFDLVAGEGYSVKPPGPGITIDIVGSHDDNFAPNKTPTTPTLYPLFFQLGLTNNNWFSVPYHTKANNSVDACTELKALTNGKVSQIVRFITTTDSPKTQSCTSTIKVFDLIPGEGVSVKPSEAGVKIGLDVY